MSAQPEVRTFRGRSLEALIPRIRDELGADAIVLRSRETLEGGVAGFFQRQVVEVEARAPLPHELDGDLRNDRATAEGLATPAVARLVEEAQPFADELARAQRGAASRAAQDLLAAHAEALAPEPGDDPAGAIAPAGLYGPQPNLPALAAAAEAPDPPEASDPPSALTPPPYFDDRDGAAPRRSGTARPAGAEELERRLLAAGLSARLAADVVGEAVDHLLPFAGARRLPQLVRRALAARIRVLAGVGPGPRTLALVGADGAGKTAATANLAVAYAAAGARVAVFALGAPELRGPLAARLEPLGIPVHAATDVAAARSGLVRMDPDVALFDTPGLGPADGPAVASLATALRALDLDEVHLTLPATSSAAAAGEANRALRGLGITHAALTHVDATAHPGAAVEAALDARLPLSYLCARATVEPADPVAVAARLL